ncbi:MAG: hypothetical protein V9F04_00935 [Dermatophilaceae bacterium]
MNTPIIRMSRLVAALFAMLLVATTLIQFVQAPSLRARSDNRRTLLDNYSKDRGSIFVGDQAIAKSTPTPGEVAFLRTYPQGELYAHVTGYYSLIYGSSAHGVLAGRPPVRFVGRPVLPAAGRHARRQATHRRQYRAHDQPQGPSRRPCRAGQPARRGRRASTPRPGRSSRW